MKSRKLKLVLSEFWSSYTVICSIALAATPFLLILAVRGIVFPLILTVLILMVSGVISFIYSLNSATVIIEKENNEIMKALRGVK